MIMCRCAALLAALFSIVAVHAEIPELRLAIVGDSTACDYPPEGVLRGWGQYIGEAFHDVRVLNFAASGRSTKTFRSEGRWKKTLAEHPEIILIQFGHNDSHGPEKAESTDAATTYRDYLRQYVEEARAAGARPILITPMHRRLFPEGELSTELEPYARAMKAVAAEMKVPLIDLYSSSGEYFTKLGESGSGETANATSDHTHFNEKGARAMTGLILHDLPDADAALAERLRPPVSGQSPPAASKP